MLIGSRPSIAKLLLILKIAQLAQQAFEPQALIVQPCECNAKVVFNVQVQRKSSGSSKSMKSISTTHNLAQHSNDLSARYGIHCHYTPQGC